MKTITVKGQGEVPREVAIHFVLGNTIRVFLKNRAADYEAFPFKVTGATESNGEWSIEGYDLECFDLRINLKDIDFVMKGRR